MTVRAILFALIATMLAGAGMYYASAFHPSAAPAQRGDIVVVPPTAPAKQQDTATYSNDIIRNPAAPVTPEDPSSDNAINPQHDQDADRNGLLDRLSPADKAVYAQYQASQKVMKAYSELVRIHLYLSDYYAEEGKVVHYLSDLGLHYPDINAPDSVKQIRLLDDGSPAAEIAEEPGRWVVMRRQASTDGRTINWHCETNAAVDTTISNCHVRSLDIREMNAAFDCAHTSSELQHYICTRDRLMDDDIRLDQIWRQYYRSAAQAGDLPDLNQWLKIHARACPEDSNHREHCLDTLMQDHIAHLQRYSD